MNRCIKVVALLLLLKLSLACNFTGQEMSNQLVLDLGEEVTLDTVKWKDKSSDYFSHEGTTNIALRLSNGKVVSVESDSFDCRREENKVSSIYIHLPKMTTEQAYREAMRLSNELGLDAQELNEWYTRRTNKEQEQDDRFQVIRNDLTPQRSLKIMHSFNDEKPWYINLGLNF